MGAASSATAQAINNFGEDTPQFIIPGVGNAFSTPTGGPDYTPWMIGGGVVALILIALFALRK